MMICYEKCDYTTTGEHWGRCYNPDAGRLIDNRIICLRRQCEKDATRILHWKNYKREPEFYCDECAEMALQVVHA